jgi:hypothetical protein
MYLFMVTFEISCDISYNFGMQEISFYSLSKMQLLSYVLIVLKHFSKLGI